MIKSKNDCGISLSEKQIQNLARKHGTPLFIINRAELVNNLNRFNNFLPRIQPYYAVKANSHPEILKVLARKNICFDVASKGEIESLLGLAVAPERMLFANTIKRTESLKFAEKQLINLMTFDSEYELYKIAEFAPNAKVMIRVKVSNVGSIVELSVKFGVEAADAIPFLIKAHRLGLKPIGVSFHVGSQCLKVENYVEALEMASIIFRDAKLKQVPLEILDIGGGFPIRHFDYENDIFAGMAPVINKELDRLFDPTIKIIAEPGRAIVGSAGILVMKVIGKSIRFNKHWYYLDDGIYGSLSGLIYDHCKYQYKILRKGKSQISTIAGPTCDGLDVISNSEEMPELEIGDIVYVPNIGAYSIASATNFNSLPLPKVIAIN
ncbi:MAG: type III PLP-dependent enzyme [Planctomycetota bacterium]|nr:type III PLP-dependent enzyme [Planctomycetota bacterium]MDI6788605.1 type III PLP-dependent enzyme [Planctomycetota bacterium]